VTEAAVAVVDELNVQAPPFVQACRALDSLWSASSALSALPGRRAAALRREADALREAVLRDLLPAVLRKESLG
jgi:hypothetical protein